MRPLAFRRPREAVSIPPRPRRPSVQTPYTSPAPATACPRSAAAPSGSVQAIAQSPAPYPVARIAPRCRALAEAAAAQGCFRPNTTRATARTDSLSLRLRSAARSYRLGETRRRGDDRSRTASRGPTSSRDGDPAERNAAPTESSAPESQASSDGRLLHRRRRCGPDYQIQLAQNTIAQARATHASLRTVAHDLPNVPLKFPVGIRRLCPENGAGVFGVRVVLPRWRIGQALQFRIVRQRKHLPTLHLRQVGLNNHLVRLIRYKDVAQRRIDVLQVPPRAPGRRDRKSVV